MDSVSLISKDEVFFSSIQYTHGVEFRQQLHKSMQILAMIPPRICVDSPFNSCLSSTVTGIYLDSCISTGQSYTTMDSHCNPNPQHFLSPFAQNTFSSSNLIHLQYTKVTIFQTSPHGQTSLLQVYTHVTLAHHTHIPSILHYMHVLFSQYLVCHDIEPHIHQFQILFQLNLVLT